MLPRAAAVALALALVPLAAGAQSKSGGFASAKPHNGSNVPPGGTMFGAPPFHAFGHHRRFIILVPLIEDSIQCEAADGYVRAANYQETWDSSDTLLANFKTEGGALALLRALRRSGYTDAAIVSSSVLADGSTQVQYRLGTRSRNTNC